MSLTRIISDQVIFKSVLADLIERSLTDKLGETVSVLDSGAVGDYDELTNTGTDNTVAFQKAIDSVTSKSGASLLIPAGYSYLISGELSLPREGITIHMAGATIVAKSGLKLFKREFPQLSQAAFIAAYPALDADNTTYFRQVTVNGGRVKLMSASTGFSFRQPFLDKFSVKDKSLVLNGVSILAKDTSVAFGIHGGWGYDFNSCSVVGDVNASTGFGGSVGSGTCLYMRPDGTNSASSHAQRISFNSCNIEYCKVIDAQKGLCTNSAEALSYTDTACMFVNGGDVESINLMTLIGGMFVTTAREMVLKGMAGFRCIGTQVQRYNNARTEVRRGGCFSFIGGGNDIAFYDIRGQAGANLTGSMVSFLASSGEQFIDISVSDFKQASGSISDLNEPDTTLQTSAIRLMTGGTGTIVGITLKDITGINLHNIVDMGDNAAVGSMSRADIRGIRNITTTVKRRIRWIPENITQLNAPELYKQMTLRLRSPSNASGASEAVVTHCIPTGLTGTITATRVTTSNVSNAVSLAIREMQDGGIFVVDLYQAAGLAAGVRVEATGLFRFDSGSSILS